VKGTSKEPQAGYEVTSTGSTTTVGRGYPDLTLAGASYLLYNGGNLVGVSGTSASAPAVAGMFSLINAQRLAIGINICVYMCIYLSLYIVVMKCSR
jgi:subtilisin family serine protease